MPEVREKQVGGRTVLAIVGTLSNPDVPGLQRRLLEPLARDPKIVLDLSEMSYVSSAGVALFVKIGNRARARGGRLLLAQPQPAVQETLAVLRLTSHELIFQIFPTAEEAVKSLEPRT